MPRVLIIAATGCAERLLHILVEAGLEPACADPALSPIPEAAVVVLNADAPCADRLLEWIAHERPRATILALSGIWPDGDGPDPVDPKC